MDVFHAVLPICLIALGGVALAQKAAQQVRRSGSFDLPCNADTAFPLFSPEGERDWVDGWDPQPVFPDRIEFSRDTVFKEGPAGEEAVWTIVDADWQTHRAEYVRVAPGSHTGHILVKIEPVDAERSRVTVSYTVTAFGENSASLLAAFSEEAYAAKMRGWKDKISAYLESRNLPVTRP